MEIPARCKNNILFTAFLFWGASTSSFAANDYKLAASWATGFHEETSSMRTEDRPLCEAVLRAVNQHGPYPNSLACGDLPSHEEVKVLAWSKTTRDPAEAFTQVDRATFKKHCCSPQRLTTVPEEFTRGAFRYETAETTLLEPGKKTALVRAYFEHAVSPTSPAGKCDPERTGSFHGWRLFKQEQDDLKPFDGFEMGAFEWRGNLFLYGHTSRRYELRTIKELKRELLLIRIYKQLKSVRGWLQVCELEFQPEK